MQRGPLRKMKEINTEWDRGYTKMVDSKNEGKEILRASSGCGLICLHVFWVVTPCNLLGRH
jgi:hypothetical protein